MRFDGVVGVIRFCGGLVSRGSGLWGRDFGTRDWGTGMGPINTHATPQPFFTHTAFCISFLLFLFYMQHGDG